MMALACAIMHSRGSHPGSPKLYDNITNIYFVKDRGKLEKYCKTMCSNCLMCMATKKDVNIHNVGIHTRLNLNEPNQYLTLDIKHSSIEHSHYSAKDSQR